MSKRKTFTKGQAVEAQRDPSAGWEPATYVRPSHGYGSPHHIVDLDAPYYIDSMSGMDVPDPSNNPRAYLTRVKVVPSRRIRARRSAPPSLECEESPGGRHVYELDEEYAQKHCLSREDTPVNCVHCGADAPDDVATEMRGSR